jgi:hypothetical protein
MKALKLILAGFGVAAGLYFIALSQKAYANNLEDYTTEMKRDTNDTGEEKPRGIQKEIEECKDDTGDIINDRQDLKAAVESGDRVRIQQAREKLHKDIKDRKKYLKDLKKSRKEGLLDKKERNTHR